MGGLDKVISFWVVVDLCTDVLFVTAFSFRVAGWVEKSHKDRIGYQLLAFQFLSCIAPLLWMQLLKLADGIQYFGVIQIVLLRMLQETAAFFLLLLLTAIGFAQSLFALDAADGHRVKHSGAVVMNLIVATILGQPDFDAPGNKFGEPFGRILVYIYTFITVMLLANILVAFFSSAYDKTVDAADDVFKAYFCSKVISTIRAPDQFVYLPPFNLIEAFFIAPFERITPSKVYAKVNSIVQGTLFCIPLAIISLYETKSEGPFAKRIRMEMLDDMSEERMRRLAQVAGIENVHDPHLSGSFTALSSSNESASLQLTRQEFIQGAKKYVEEYSQTDSSNDDTLGAHTYARGWTWEEGNNPPSTGHLTRTFTFGAPRTNTIGQGDDSLLVSMGIEERNEGETVTEAPVAQMQVWNVTQTIAFSSTWGVPLLFIEAIDENGSPLPAEELCSSALFLSKDIKGDPGAPSPLPQASSVFPTVSIGENPGNGHTGVYLHPCQTASSVSQVLSSQSSSPEGHELSYIEAFVMLCSTAVEMRPGSKARSPNGEKAINVQDFVPEHEEAVITKESFTALLKKLPQVKVSMSAINILIRIS